MRPSSFGCCWTKLRRALRRHMKPRIFSLQSGDGLRVGRRFAPAQHHARRVQWQGHAPLAACGAIVGVMALDLMMQRAATAARTHLQ